MSYKKTINSILQDHPPEAEVTGSTPVGCVISLAFSVYPIYAIAYILYFYGLAYDCVFYGIAYTV